MLRLQITAIFLGLAACASIASASNVSLPYIENFENPKPSANTTADANYLEFTPSLGAGASSVDAAGVLHFTSPDASDQSLTVTPFPAPTKEVIVFGQVTASNSNGNYNVGMIFGQNRLVFHPGYVDIPGAFRVEGPGGFGNTSMGFVPANNVLHQYEVHSFPNGDFTIKLTDGANPNNVFTRSFNNLASYGGPIGFLRSGPNTGDGQFDNLIISAVPEPSTLVLGSLAALGLAAFARRRQAE